MKRTYHLHADDVTADVNPKTPPPAGATFRVYEILARDPETSVGRWCSAQVQQTAEIIRYEVDLPDGEDDPDLIEWADDLATELFTQALRDNADRWYGSSTFDDWPHAAVEVEVDDDDLTGLDPTSWEYDKKFIDKLNEDETCPTSVPRPNPKPAPAGALESQ